MRTIEQQKFNQTIPGWFGTGDIAALESLASPIETGVIVELGSMHGRSAYCLSTSSPTSTIYCFDYWPARLVKTADEIDRLNSIEIFLEYTAECKNIVATKLSPIEKAEWNDKRMLDLVFIDISHTNPNDWETIEYWLPKIKSGGILCGHDYYIADRDGVCHYPDVVENALRLEKILGKPVTLYKDSCVWSFLI